MSPNTLDLISQAIGEAEKVIVGQRGLIQKVFIALLSDGHVLLEGPPGLAKTLLASAVGQAIGGTFRRIQMVPDMMPSDLVGTYLYINGRFEVEKGPVIGPNLVLVDEINRAPAKTQAALLQAMQERQVTVMGKDTFALADPFIVLATQNPVEQEGTYPLPEAQLDRFLFKLLVSYPSKEAELRILENAYLDQRDRLEGVRAVLQPGDLVSLREEIKKSVKVERPAQLYLVDLCRATRDPRGYGLKELEGKIRMGASPRATLALRDAARVQAFFNGRYSVHPEDIHEVTMDVLRHRIVLEYGAEAEGFTADEAIRQILA
ncbi:MAG: MoxR family ATPase, partial [Candidatus Rokubacteria bacterium]|nr:MoxR family ATPase [Candidatus Rokubacteria bacterium]